MRWVTARRLPAVALVNPLAAQHPLVAEAAEIDAPILAEADEFAQGPPDGRGLLHAVSGETRGEVEVLEVSGETDDRVLVQGVEVVVAAPGVDDLDRLEGRNVPRQ